MVSFAINWSAVDKLANFCRGVVPLFEQVRVTKPFRRHIKQTTPTSPVSRKAVVADQEDSS